MKREKDYRKQFGHLVKVAIGNVLDEEITECKIEGSIADIKTAQEKLTAYIIYCRAEAFAESGFIISHDTMQYLRDCKYIAVVCREQQRCRIFLSPYGHGEKAQQPERLHDEYGELCYLYRESHELV